MSSGITATQECIAISKRIMSSKGDALDWAIFEIEPVDDTGKTFQTAVSATWPATEEEQKEKSEIGDIFKEFETKIFPKFQAALKAKHEEKAPVYALLNFYYYKGDRKITKTLFVTKNHEYAKVKQKMLFASSTNAVKKAFETENVYQCEDFGSECQYENFFNHCENK